MKENSALAALIRIAMSLLPEAEMLGSVEASNNVCLERSYYGTRPVSGIMEVSITTYTQSGTERTYLLLRNGPGHILDLRCETPRQ